MNDYGNAYLEKQACDTAPGLGRPLNLRENLEHELARAQANTARIQELLGLLDKNPEVNRIMELLGKSY